MSGRGLQHFVSVRRQKLGFVHIFTQILNNLAMQLCYAMATARWVRVSRLVEHGPDGGWLPGTGTIGSQMIWAAL